MKPLNKEMYETLVSNYNLIAELEKSINDLNRFHKEPDEVVSDKLSKLKEGDGDYDIFKDLSVGLMGTYTRSEAMILGRKNMKHIVETVIDKIIENNKKIDLESVESNNIVKMNYESLSGGYNFDYIMKNFKTIKSISARREYLVTNLYNTLSPEISTSLESQKDMVSFVNDYAKYLDNLKPVYVCKKDIQSMKDTSMHYNEIESRIGDLVKDNNLDNDNAEILINIDFGEYKQVPDDMDVEEKYLLVEVNKYMTNNNNEDLFTVFESILNTTKKYVTESNTYISENSKYIDDIKKPMNVENLSDKFKKITDSYDEGNMTSDVYEVSSNVYMKMIKHANDIATIGYQKLFSDIKNINDYICMVSKSTSIIAKVIDISKKQG